MREPPFCFYENSGLGPHHWNIIFYGTPFTPSFDQDNSLVASIGSSFPSHTSRTSPPTPAVNMDALALLVTIHKNEAVIAPSRTIVDRIQKRPRVEGST